jgi:hypothetical protein
VVRGRLVAILLDSEDALVVAYVLTPLDAMHWAMRAGRVAWRLVSDEAAAPTLVAEAAMFGGRTANGG